MAKLQFCNVHLPFISIFICPDFNPESYLKLQVQNPYRNNDAGAAGWWCESVGDPESLNGRKWDMTFARGGWFFFGTLCVFNITNLQWKYIHLESIKVQGWMWSKREFLLGQAMYKKYFFFFHLLSPRESGLPCLDRWRHFAWLCATSGWSWEALKISSSLLRHR